MTASVASAALPNTVDRSEEDEKGAASLFVVSRVAKLRLAELANR